MRSGFQAESIAVNPKVPTWFWADKPIEKRSPGDLIWLGKPFIKSVPNPHFPEGNRYDVYCLETKNSDHPSVWGMFGTLEEAVQRAKEGPPWSRSDSGMGSPS